MTKCWNWRDNGALEASVRKGVWVQIPPWSLTGCIPTGREMELKPLTMWVRIPPAR